MSNSLFSKEMQDQLKELKGQLTKGRDTNSPEGENKKPTEPVSLLTQKQVKKTVKQLDSEHVDDDKVLFMQAMHGVNQLEDKNVRSPASTTKAGKPDAATLSKRAAAQGSDASDLGAGLSDMQALLNPVAAEAYLSYKQPTLQNKIFDQLKKGKLRWLMNECLNGLYGTHFTTAQRLFFLLYSSTATPASTDCNACPG